MTSEVDKRQAKTRQLILEQSLKMIADQGIDKVSWRAIARAVNYSPAGLYEYFDNKDAIVRALAHEGLRQLDQALAQAGDDSSIDASIEAKLVALGEAYISFSETHRDYFQLIFASLPSSRISFEQTPKGAYTRLLDLFKQGIRQNIFQEREDYNLEAISYSYWSLVHGMASLRAGHLRTFAADFVTVNREAMKQFISGLTC